jgi:outer membrane protein assembly factor BamB
MEAEWPGFRGPERDGIVHGARIKTDWAASPPVEMWRRPIGPGWSSFAVHGDRFYTQEQRGDEEIVTCYNVATGEPVWTHRDSARFWESNGGAGPRGTPMHSNGCVYTFGATGIVNTLDARDGSVVWSRNAASDAKKKIPMWGFAGSPLVVDDAVIIAAAGKLVAYDLATGNPRWFGPDSGWGYSSPHLLTVDGVAQIVLLNGAGAIGVAPENGALLWKHRWPGDGIVQPALTADGDVLIGTGSGLGDDAGIGVRRIAVKHGFSGWTVEERWTSNGLKPYFNDFVVHKGHAFGFDGSILACIDVNDGQRKWKAAVTATANSFCCPSKICCWCCRNKVSWRWSMRPQISSRNWRDFRRSKARRGTIRCWSVTFYWFATARRWSHSGCLSCAVDGSCLREH